MTEQLALWRGQFGAEYIERNKTADMQALTRMWARMLQSIKPGSILEVGANVGLNLQAIKTISDASLHAVEPNVIARRHLLESGIMADDGDASNLPFKNESFDLVFTSGVLIHVHPDNIYAACREIIRVSKRYVLCSEYFSKVEREVPYRGQSGALFTRDFGKLFLNQGLQLLDYGFFWTGAGCTDDLTWWLFDKLTF
jgi:pseudaminic acid biosynthesis-associated methylase